MSAFTFTTPSDPLSTRKRPRDDDAMDTGDDWVESGVDSYATAMRAAEEGAGRVTKALRTDDVPTVEVVSRGDAIDWLAAGVFSHGKKRTRDSVGGANEEENVTEAAEAQAEMDSENARVSKFVRTMSNDEKKEDVRKVEPDPDEPLIRCTLHPTCRFLPPLTIPLYEKHYTRVHTNRCAVCVRTLPTPRLLEIHVQECHDSWFAVRAGRGESMYACLHTLTVPSTEPSSTTSPPSTDVMSTLPSYKIVPCDRTFLTPGQRDAHLIRDHSYPASYVRSKQFLELMVLGMGEGEAEWWRGELEGRRGALQSQSAGATHSVDAGALKSGAGVQAKLTADQPSNIHDDVTLGKASTSGKPRRTRTTTDHTNPNPSTASLPSKPTTNTTMDVSDDDEPAHAPPRRGISGVADILQWIAKEGIVAPAPAQSNDTEAPPPGVVEPASPTVPQSPVGEASVPLQTMTSRQRKTLAYREKVAQFRKGRKGKGQGGLGASSDVKNLASQDEVSRGDTMEVDVGQIPSESAAHDESLNPSPGGRGRERGRGGRGKARGKHKDSKTNGQMDTDVGVSEGGSDVSGPSQHQEARHGRDRGRGRGKGRGGKLLKTGPDSVSEAPSDPPTADTLSTITNVLSSIRVSQPPSQFSFGRGAHRAFGTTMHRDHVEWTFGRILRAHKGNRPFVVYGEDGAVVEVRQRVGGH